LAAVIYELRYAWYVSSPPKKKVLCPSKKIFTDKDVVGYYVLQFIAHKHKRMWSTYDVLQRFRASRQ